MAITISKEPAGIYPAYNDSYIEFSSSLSGNDRAEITALPAEVFVKPFSIFPDLDGNYSFNLKEIAKTVLNVNRFEDSNFFDDAYFKSIGGLYLLQSITIEVFNSTTSETLVKGYEFYKSVKQVGEGIHENPFQLLMNSKNGIDHYATYFEGFPFHFDIQRVVHVGGKELKVKNSKTGVWTAAMTTTSTGAYRVNIDRSESLNWTDDNFMPLIEGVNNLEIYEDDIFKSNLFLKKRETCEGVYLKWFNSDGGFSHYLFEEYLTEGVKGKDIDYISSGKQLNVGALNSDVMSVGKRAENTFKIRAKCDSRESETLKSLFSSPMVQVYTSRVAHVKGEFVNVAIKGNFNFKNKVANNEFIVTVEMPEMNTLKL